MGWGRKVTDDASIPPIYGPRESLANVDVATPATQERQFNGLPEAGYVNSVAVNQTAGTGVSFDVEIWKGPTTVPLNHIFTFAGWLKANGTFRAHIPNTAYANVEEEQYLILRVIPNAGADNDYDAEIVCTLEP